MMISTHLSNVDKIVYIDLGLNPTFHTENGKCKKIDSINFKIPFSV